LKELGFVVPILPSGAFYIYVDCSRHSDDSYRFAQHCLDVAGVAIAPGIDFGTYGAAHHMRFAYTTSYQQLEEGIRRLQNLLIHRN
jgi:aspartate/methionine/tyrosine aminotransferase